MCYPVTSFLSSAERGGQASRKADRGEIQGWVWEEGWSCESGRGRGKPGVLVFTVGLIGTRGKEIVTGL